MNSLRLADESLGLRPPPNPQGMRHENRLILTSEFFFKIVLVMTYLLLNTL
jgi:hypothetical protein